MTTPAPHTEATTGAAEPGDRPPPVSWGQAWRFWLKLGFISFGGPAGQIALMHAELVERRRWISEGRFLHALNYCMLLPGPEAQQLATYLGWLMHRSWGGVVAGALFVLPSLFILVALSWVYLRYGQLPVVAGVFYGLKAGVLALVVQATQRIATRALKHPALWALAGVAFVALAVFDTPFPLLVLGAAAAGLLGARRWPQVFSGRGGAGHGPSKTSAATPSSARAWIDDDTPTPPHARPSRRGALRVLAWGVGLWVLAMGLLVAGFGLQHTLSRMGLFFSQAALVTFGGAYAVLPYVVQAAVEQQQWLTAPQMMDGLALGETTPGPLIMVVAFVGFLGGWQQAALGPEALWLGGLLGALVATFFTFLPSFVFILAGGPLVEATQGKLGFTAPLTAITAAVVGVVLHLALFFASHLLWPAGAGGGFDAVAAGIAALAALALWRWQWGVLPVLAGCAGLGLLVTLLR